ncbi:MAG TPA: hypothetical protein V6C81_20390 [Planktothrix sp.]|jgi:DNA-binding NarL/FixJ family response regulator
MNSLTKIFIAERDCESLVTTMLWLEQYPDFDVYGSMITEGCLTQQIEEVQPDIVMLGVPAMSAEAAMAIKTIRSVQNAPSILVLSKAESAHEAALADCDGFIGPKTGLKDVADIIETVTTRQRVTAIAPATVQMAKAG